FFTVVDDGGNAIYIERIDEAQLGSFEVALEKAQDQRRYGAALLSRDRKGAVTPSALKYPLREDLPACVLTHSAQRSPWSQPRLSLHFSSRRPRANLRPKAPSPTPT